MSDKTPAKRTVYHRANDGTVVGWTTFDATGKPSSYCYASPRRNSVPPDLEAPPDYRSSLSEQTSFPRGPAGALIYSRARIRDRSDDDTQDR